MYRVIIADDEEHVRAGIADVIDWNNMGFEVVQCVADGREVIAYLQDHAADVILTDIKMTFVSGLEVAKYVHREKRNERVVLLSGYQEFKLAQEAIQYQVAHYLLKPTDVNELQAVFQAIRQELDDSRSGSTSPRPDATAVESAAASLHIRVAKEYMEHHYANDISLVTVAESVGLSTAYLSKLFKQATGENFSDYLSCIRVEKAKQFLHDPRYKIYEISERVGYQNLKHFYKLFKQITGVTPSEYRNRAEKEGDR
ncbi:MAG: response regulator [Paenibacillaceae bacterium]|jgi:YesN/AraC family two-component response regulator|nr:response regulator [Paenibacillaceae bacterium]